MDILNHAALVRAGESILGGLQIAGMDFETLHLQAVAQLGGSSSLMEFSQVHQCHAMAAFGLIEIGSGNDDGQSFRGKMSERIPELAPRDRIDARGRLVEEQDARLRD